jgi:hypothetical protein
MAGIVFRCLQVQAAQMSHPRMCKALHSLQPRYHQTWRRLNDAIQPNTMIQDDVHCLERMGPSRPVTKAVWFQPAAALEILIPCRDLTGFGKFQLDSFPCPRAPESPRPHVIASPFPTASNQSEEKKSPFPQPAPNFFNLILGSTKTCSTETN